MVREVLSVFLCPIYAFSGTSDTGVPVDQAAPRQASAGQSHTTTIPQGEFAAYAPLQHIDFRHTRWCFILILADMQK